MVPSLSQRSLKLVQVLELVRNPCMRRPKAKSRIKIRDKAKVGLVEEATRMVRSSVRDV